MTHGAATVMDWGFRAAEWRASVTSGRFALHNDVKLYLMLAGRIAVVVGERAFEAGSRQMLVHWGAIPHRITQVADGTTLAFVQVPTAIFAEWQLGRGLSDALFSGEVIREPDHSAERFRLDQLLFKRWVADFSAGPERLAAALLEIHARLVRLSATADVQTRAVRRTASVDHVADIFAFVGRAYLTPIDVNSVAAEVGLHPKYVLRLFRQTCGFTFWSYVLRLRLLHATHLLISTERKVVDIAFESGFSSAPWFYSVFRRTFGMSPLELRKAAQQRPLDVQLDVDVAIGKLGSGILPYPPKRRAGEVDGDGIV